MPPLCLNVFPLAPFCSRLDFAVAWDKSWSVAGRRTGRPRMNHDCHDGFPFVSFYFLLVWGPFVSDGVRGFRSFALGCCCLHIIIIRMGRSTTVI
ncbi:hypothetical protein BDV59DRAFT_45417 [Aspergillus ambiguus]|uniref:uncharacterized protein n=1 Tax=Aspergillus ambiguus TaxID=176160 RepID=UPI003CCD061C